MKKIFKLFIAATLLSTISSCTKDFEEVNLNPVQPTTLDPVYLFANAEFNLSQNVINFHIALTQQLHAPFTGVLDGGNHNALNDVNSRTLYDNLFTTSVKFLADVLNQTKDNGARSNLYNMARIIRAHVFMTLVDTYGDVPYSESGRAYLEQNFLPVYDDQNAIYADILKELDEATTALDAAKQIEASDIFYKGNIAQWKKFGNSLLLRAAMRYTKADPAKAQLFAAKAITAGVMTSNADNAFVAFNAAFNSIYGYAFQGTERANYYLGEPFVQLLKTTTDPRLPFISVKYQFPSNPIATVGTENTTPADQIGMPYGYNESTIATAPGFPGKEGAAWKYSQVNRKTFGKIDVPDFIITHAQTQLLVAEAVFRGWAPGTAATFYEAGVRAHMDQLKQVDASAVVSATDQTNYLTANPFNPATALEQINTQYWIATFMNGTECWANLRRSGFPVLVANPYPNADASVKGAFVHRLVYPDREKSVNAANYQAAVSRQGPDNMATRVFWDKP